MSLSQAVAAEVRRPREPDNRPRPLTSREVEFVLGAADQRMKTWLLLALYAGLRSHEIAKISGQDVDERTIYVMGKGRQSAFVPTHPILWTLAQTYPSRGYWFPSVGKSGHIAATSISHKSSVYFTSLGIDGALHRCRHVYGSQLLRNGANIRVVQDLLRHKNLSSTAKYTEVDDAERRAAIETLRLSA
jgi:integrase/recombinase XerD